MAATTVTPTSLTNDLYPTGGNYALFAKLLPAEHIYGQCN